MVIGAITALFMGFLGIVQNDIKRVVAYSTLSQLGYMTVALGASAYSVAVFHLMTHAFFKALLFLAAGSVIIAVHHNQDIRYMGGLKKYMPITWITSLIGSLALIGTPFLSGFYSKETIIEAVKLSHLPGGRSRLLGGADRGVRHGLLFVPHVFPGVPRQGAFPPGHASRQRADDASRPSWRHAARNAVGGDRALARAGFAFAGDRLHDHRADAVWRFLRQRDLRRRPPSGHARTQPGVPRRGGDGPACGHHAAVLAGGCRRGLVRILLSQASGYSCGDPEALQLHPQHAGQQILVRRVLQRGLRQGCAPAGRQPVAARRSGRHRWLYRQRLGASGRTLVPPGAGPSSPVTSTITPLPC